MIDLYYWPTPNGWKITILLEECGLPYHVLPVDIRRGEQFAPDFVAISPNNRIPAIVDHGAEGGSLPVFESGAILVYLAQKTGRFLPEDAAGFHETLQWVSWQVGELGPMAGQLSHFVNYAPQPEPYALARYRNEYARLLGVLDRHLADREFLAGAYSIADMACWPWLLPYKRFGQPLDPFPNLLRWHRTMKARPAVQRGVEAARERRSFGPMDDKAREALFGVRHR
ncbi:MAG: glutathione S-transferase N-terminal domain-containing protein [Burkholderiaceae bacterium]|nr:glutathione S-transferase N-terminal domain-containing protein [Burkholderiaceae bacterium]